MVHPLRAFVSATDSTNDALILADIEDQNRQLRRKPDK
jgi:hypothetical protein